MAIPGATAKPAPVMSGSAGSAGNQHRLPAPAFGSSPNLQALALDAAAEPSLEPRTFQEITVVSADQPKLLSRLSEVMVCPSHWEAWSKEGVWSVAFRRPMQCAQHVQQLMGCCVARLS